MTKGLDAAGADISIPSKHKPFRGQIGDLRIYRRAINAQRIAELFEEETPYRLAKPEPEEDALE